MFSIFEFADQFPVLIAKWILSFVEPYGHGWAILARVILTVVPILVVFPLIFALTTWAERKILARIQNRIGPNRVGPFGLFQPIADGIKTLTKEDIVPARADHFLHTLAPVLMLIPAFVILSVLPIGRNMTPTALNIGVLFFFAAGAISEVGIFLAGWASHNKYSLLGGMRALSQMISYEIPFILSTLTVIMVTGTLSTTQIVEAQGGHWAVSPDNANIFIQLGHHLWNTIASWHVFQPWGFFGFIIYFVAALSELNRSPFDIPEGESEIIAGHHTEYSGWKFALFAFSEYISMIAICGMGVTLFLGGWMGPKIIPSWAWFFLKTFSLMFVMIWIRGTLPRLRVDQLLSFAWKFLLPMTLVNILAAGIQMFVPIAWLGWLLSAALMIAAFRILSQNVIMKNIEKRTYQLV